MNKCPLLHIKYKRKCKIDACPFNSIIMDSGCFYNEKFSIANYAYHKKISKRKINQLIDSINNQVHHTIKLFLYASYCSEIEPTLDDKILFNELSKHSPYNIPVISHIITIKRFSDMRNKNRFKKFLSVSGINVNMSVEEFLSKTTSIPNLGD